MSNINNIPYSIITHEILKYLTPYEVLTFAKTCKTYNTLIFTTFPELKNSFSLKHNIGKCLNSMIDFIKTGSMISAEWSFSYNWDHKHSKNAFCLSLSRTSKNQYIIINNKSTIMSYDEFMLWFETHVFPKWDNIQFHTRCWYKSKNKINEYHKLTMIMMNLLCGSL